MDECDNCKKLEKEIEELKTQNGEYFKALDDGIYNLRRELDEMAEVL